MKKYLDKETDLNIFRESIETGDLKRVEEYLDKKDFEYKYSYISKSCKKARKNTHYEVLQKIVEDILKKKNVQNKRESFELVCEMGDFDLFENYKIQSNQNTLYHVSIGSNMKMVKVMISRGAKDWSKGIEGVIKSEKELNKQLLQFLIQKGGTFSKKAIGYLYKRGDIELINSYSSLDQSDHLAYGLKKAFETKNEKLLHFLTENFALLNYRSKILAGASKSGDLE